MKTIGWMLLLLLATGYWAPVWAQRTAEPEAVSLDRLPRIFGLSVAASNPVRLHLATPMGLFLAGPEGKAEAVPGVRGNAMAFAVHPRNPRRMLVGGHVDKSGSIGVMLTTDGGRTWSQISQEAAGHVGFHILEISKADPNIVYGVTNGLRVSSDGGRTWRQVGTLPKELIHFAASAVQVNTLYAATRRGLLVSRDQGATWRRAGTPPRVTSMVHVTNAGQVYVFVIGVGLLAAQESDLIWKTVSTAFDDRILLRLVSDSTLPGRLFAATLTGAVTTSADGGRNWIAFEGSHRASPAFIAKGKQLFQTYCQACHGREGRGQHTTAGFDPKNPPAIVAPALDDSAHGWHHSDENLINTILNGSPRKGSPMVAWKGPLSRADAENLVAYIKSLWNFRSLACQGARHMACMRH